MSHILTGREQSSASKYEHGIVRVNGVPIPKSRCIATDINNAVSPGKCKAIEVICNLLGVNPETESQQRFKCSYRELHWRTAKHWIDELNKRVREQAGMAVETAEGVM